MEDQMQVSITFISTLLASPEFREGLEAGTQAARENFFSEDLTQVWDEEKIVKFVSRELSYKLYRNEKRIEKKMGWPSRPYLRHPGFVMGYLDQMLTLPEKHPKS